MAGEQTPQGDPCPQNSADTCLSHPVRLNIIYANTAAVSILSVFRGRELGLNLSSEGFCGAQGFQQTYLLLNHCNCT